MISNKYLKYAIRYTFYVVMALYWLKLAYLGVQLYHAKTLGQALGLLETQNLFLVQIIRNYLIGNGDWLQIFKLSLSDISISTLALYVIWWLDDVIKHEVELYIGASLIVPLASLVAFLMIMSSGTVAKGFYYGNILGMVLMVVSLIIFLSMVVKFIIRFNKGDMYDRKF